MRLFTAIDFDENIKNYLKNVTIELKDLCTNGSFTHEENFHLTLQFLGEIHESKIANIKTAIEDAMKKHPNFTITANKVGSFGRSDGRIVWIGLQESTALMELQKTLSVNFRNLNIPFDEKEFKPHITLGRRIILKPEIKNFSTIIDIDKITINVNCISLMESTKLNNKLVYSSLHSFNLINKLP
jgi:2''-5'' RNA ligase